MPEIYERRGEWSGYTVRKSEKGFVVEHWSSGTGELTDDKYLLPYGVHGFGKDTDLNAIYSETATIGDLLYTFKGRVLHKGHIVQ